MEKGGIMCSRMERHTPLYQAIYRQRTAAERINSQAKELGIERPKVRNLNTLIYVVINVRALARARAINAGLLSIPNGGR